MHQPVNVPLERVAHEFAQWRAVPEPERSAAPPWWWGPAFEAVDQPQPMPAEWCSNLGLPQGSTVGAAAEVLLALFADQTALPWSGDFPYRTRPDDRPKAR